MLASLLIPLLFSAPAAYAALNVTGSTCTVTPLPSTGTTDPDDTPQILQAFTQCGKNGKIILAEGLFHIGQIMRTTEFSNVDIEIHGTLKWSSDIQYWLRSSISVTYAGRSTAWLLGGTDIRLRGFGKALFDGNGQLWYDQNRNQGNQNGRPISLTLWNARNVLVDGITWRQSQFWHTFVAHSENVTMTNLDMNSTSNSQWSTVNTDGVDTWNSKDVVIANWTVTCGDVSRKTPPTIFSFWSSFLFPYPLNTNPHPQDCISMKGNSTNISVSNVSCHESGCACIGSLGSQASQPDYVENVSFNNISCTHSSNAAWIKTYSGTGRVRNITFANFQLDNVNQPVYITPCIYTGQGCDTSRLPIEDVRWVNITGTSRYNVAGGIHCSASNPCKNLTMENVNIKPMSGGTTKWLCSNIQNQASSGIPCTESCPANWPQQLSGNR
ncbi:glycoside hydrolase family 28 protein [Pseudomassariella vexata]|uniref:Glycoside hydrolase family 28 protein n=1 Tax=Pseudomassariella vexata TaxID=1141098 RepID=A0A1Y2EI50_9PEZI|nr:glycoside hydrolase family 28 protein [Pseudomassariella vexata]ORY71248.1 glycoside hydrolase family 28 protein [Pseudomassariella vexata]